MITNGESDCGRPPSSNSKSRVESGGSETVKTRNVSHFVEACTAGRQAGMVGVGSAINVEVGESGRFPLE